MPVTIPQAHNFKKQDIKAPSLLRRLFLMEVLQLKFKAVIGAVKHSL
jgi:hypothetical protein